MLRVATACIFSISQLPKVVRSWCVLRILTWTCASCHKGVYFFDMSTSKSGPDLVSFAHFDLEMCFAPQRRTLFRHLNFQKPPEHEVFCAFWLPNVLRTTTACNFSSLIWPASSAPAALASLLFDPPEPQIIGKNRMFRDCPTFSRTCIFFLLSLSFESFFWLFLFSDLLSSSPLLSSPLLSSRLVSSLLFSSRLFSSLLFSSLLFSSLLWLFPPLLFHVSILSEVWLIRNFLR